MSQQQLFTASRILLSRPTTLYEKERESFALVQILQAGGLALTVWIDTFVENNSLESLEPLW